MAQTDGRRRRTRPASNVLSGRVTEILYGLHGERRERVAALRKRSDLAVRRLSATFWDPFPAHCATALRKYAATDHGSAPLPLRSAILSEITATALPGWRGTDAALAES